MNARLRLVDPIDSFDLFDRQLSSQLRYVSRVHWTPPDVCARVAEWLALKPGERALDVGSGVGKLCILAGRDSEGTFVGVEQRAELVRQARQLAAAFDVPATFVHGDAFEVDWHRFDALYFYNPFDEARFSLGLRIDESIAVGAAVFDALVARTQRRLATLPDGMRVVTFHGLGGELPPAYRLVAKEEIADGKLELWVHRPAR